MPSRLAPGAKTSAFALRRGRNQPELLEHQESIEHQVERHMFAVAKPQHLDVVHADGATGRLDVTHRSMEDAVVGTAEGALLDGHVVEDVDFADVDVSVRKGVQPAAIKLDAR